MLHVKHFSCIDIQNIILKKQTSHTFQNIKFQMHLNCFSNWFSTQKFIFISFNKEISPNWIRGQYNIFKINKYRFLQHLLIKLNPNFERLNYGFAILSM